MLIIGAAAMPLLMGSAGFAVDTIQLAFWKRQLQRAADSAAIAGAHARVQGASPDPAIANDLDEHIDFDLEQNATPVLAAKRITAGSFAAGTISSATCAARAVPRCYEKAVEVRLTSVRRLPFMSLFTHSTTTINTQATAAIVGNGEFCMVSLYNGNDPGIIARGNSDLNLSCGIMTNSRAGNAVDSNGAARINADPVAAVGGVNGGRWYGPNTQLQPYSTAISDPFGSVPDPVMPAGCTTASALEINGSNDESHPTEITQTSPGFTNGCVGSLSIKSGYVKLAPGNWYLNNGALDIKGKLIGNNVTINLMGSGSDVSLNGQGKLSITAPIDGDNKGVAIFRDRNATGQIKLTGGADVNITGGIYGANTDFWIGGNTDMAAQCLQLVGRILQFQGGGSIQNNCSGTGGGAFKAQAVRLVS